MTEQFSAFESLKQLESLNKWCSAQTQKTFNSLSMLKHDVESKPKSETPTQQEIRELGRIEGRLEILHAFQDALHVALDEWKLRHESE